MMKATGILCVAATLLTLATAEAQTTSYVYVANNATPHVVSGFSVSATGALAPIGTFATGGTGSACLIPTEHAVVATGNRLYVANQLVTGGVASVSGFDINPATGALTLIAGSPFVVAANLPCVGPGNVRNTMALAAHPSGLLLAAATASGIHMFAIDPATGGLSPVAGSPFAGSSSYTVNMAFSADGRYLTAARQAVAPAPSVLETYAVSATGALTTLGSVTLAGAASVEYSCDGSLVLAGSSTSAGLRTYAVSSSGTLTLAATGATPGAPAAPVALSVGDRFAFASSGAAIHSFAVGAGGSLTTVPGSPFANAGGLAAIQPPIAVSGDGTYLFALSAAPALLKAFRIGATGTLTPAATIGGVSALGSIAAYPGKICDITAPVTTITTTPAPNGAGWNNTDVMVTLTATDNGGTGVKEIHYSLSGAQTDTQTVAGDTATFVVSAEGITEITFFAVDNAGNAEAPQTHTVRIDRTPPTASCSVDKPVLWPPNHKLVAVTISVVVMDTLSGPGGFALASATSSEPDSGLDADDQPDDIQGVTIGSPATSVLLRAERGPDGPGRVYTLTYDVFDVAGNSASCSVTVTVPRGRGKSGG